MTPPPSGSPAVVAPAASVPAEPALLATTEDTGAGWFQADRETALEQRLIGMDEELGRLRARVDALEQQLEAVEPPRQQARDDSADEAFAAQQSRGSTRRIDRLRRAGLAPTTAEFIDRKLQDYELQRLYLRDQAVREGWFGTTRYTEAVNGLEGGASDLRGELSETDYDLYLYATGQPNRLKIGSVMAASAGAQAGLQPDDVLLRYAGERVYNSAELRELTAAGNAGENVVVEVLRGQDLLQLYLPRGPIGVRLNLDRVQP